MSTREIRTCDVCGADADPDDGDGKRVVKSHRIEVDGSVYDVDLCDAVHDCDGAKFLRAWNGLSLQVRHCYRGPRPQVTVRGNR